VRNNEEGFHELLLPQFLQSRLSPRPTRREDDDVTRPAKTYPKLIEVEMEMFKIFSFIAPKLAYMLLMLLKWP
jgi:hypothetical protein